MQVPSPKVLTRYICGPVNDFAVPLTETTAAFWYSSRLPVSFTHDHQKMLRRERDEGKPGEKSGNGLPHHCAEEASATAL